MELVEFYMCENKSYICFLELPPSLILVLLLDQNQSQEQLVHIWSEKAALPERIYLMQIFVFLMLIVEFVIHLCLL